MTRKTLLFVFFLCFLCSLALGVSSGHGQFYGGASMPVNGTAGILIGMNGFANDSFIPNLGGEVEYSTIGAFRPGVIYKIPLSPSFALRISTGVAVSSYFSYGFDVNIPNWVIIAKYSGGMTWDKRPTYEYSLSIGRNFEVIGGEEHQKGNPQK